MAIFNKLGTPDSSPDDDIPILNDFNELEEIGSNAQPGIRALKLKLRLYRYPAWVD